MFTAVPSTLINMFCSLSFINFEFVGRSVGRSVNLYYAKRQHKCNEDEHIIKDKAVRQLQTTNHQEFLFMSLNYSWKYTTIQATH